MVMSIFTEIDKVGLNINMFESLNKCGPLIVLGTLGRVLNLIRNMTLKLGNIKLFIIDDNDKMLDTLG